jgi:hypothetical protein
MPAGIQNGRAAWLLHCPWRGGTGCAFQDFTLKLPAARRIRLTGATALRADAIGKSDGVVFRIYLNGRKVLDEPRTESVWKPFSIELTAFAGRTVNVRFETDPGPRDDASFDFSLWADRTLKIDGMRNHPAPRAAPVALNLRSMSARPSAGVAPLAGAAGTHSVAKSGDAVTLQYVAGRERLIYVWRPPATADAPPFGDISLRARLAGRSESSIPLARGASLVWAGDAKPMGPTHLRVSGDRAVMTRPYGVGSYTVTLTVVGRLVRKSLVLEVSTDKPGVAAMDSGAWGPVALRRSVTTPYYSGRVYYLPREDLFVNAFLDWTDSNASAHDGNRARYDSLTDGTRAPLRERAVYTAAWNLPEAFPNVPNPPSPYRAEMGERMVLDIWGGRYLDIARSFQSLADCGIRSCYAIIHNWQRSGYDNALPNHVPAAVDKGGDADMKTLVETGKRLGYRVALHENYVDYYPNYDSYNVDDIALDSGGAKQKAWFNEGTGIQSLAVKPAAILRLAATQSPEIRRRYGSNACYLDVHSAVPPWFHVDDRAGEPGAGEFDSVWKVHAGLWDWERKNYGGPVTGEGANHWFWSGLLDGVEAQFGAGWDGGQGMTAPLAVDFDLLRIHPLQMNHGMGYYERWWTKPAWAGSPPMVALDQYRMQELAYGHSAFLGGATWNNVPVAWLESNLVVPVASRYAEATVVDIRYLIGGKWLDSSGAARAGVWDRVRVRYANGLTITANNAARPLMVDGVVLPQYGWVASGAGVKAYTAERGGAVVDYCETATSVFANARNAQDWSLSGVKRIQPTVGSFRQTGPRTFAATYRWRVGERLQQDSMCFVHFSAMDAGQDSRESVAFQGDHPLERPTSTWLTGADVLDGPYTVRIPDGVKDGDYVWSIGLYEPQGGRVSLDGVDDGRGRIILGQIHVRDNGSAISLSPQSRGEAGSGAVYLKHVNTRGKVVNFGTVATDGSVLLRREGAEWVLRTWPRDRKFQVSLDSRRFGSPASVRSSHGVIRVSKHGARWSLPLDGSSEYRWSAQAAGT